MGGGVGLEFFSAAVVVAATVAPWGWAQVRAHGPWPIGPMPIGPMGAPGSTTTSHLPLNEQIYSAQHQLIGVRGSL